MTRKAILLTLGCALLLAVAGCHGLLCPCDNCGCCGGPCCGSCDGDCGPDCCPPGCPPGCHPIRDRLAGGCCEPCCRSECCGGPCGQCGGGCCGSCNGPCGDCCDPCADPCCHCCFHPLRWIFSIFHGDGCSCGDGCCGERCCGQCCGERCCGGANDGWGPSYYEPSSNWNGGGCSHCNNGYANGPYQNNGYAYQRGSNAPTPGYRSYNGYNGNGYASDRVVNGPAPTARSYNGRYNGDPRNGNANGNSRLDRGAALADDPGPFTPEGSDVALKPASDAPMPHRAPRPQDQ